MYFAPFSPTVPLPVIVGSSRGSVNALRPWASPEESKLTKRYRLPAVL